MKTTAGQAKHTIDPLASAMPYIRIARPDHWFKNLFMIPGAIVAVFDAPKLLEWEILVQPTLAVVSVCFVTSSNYVINEILDAPMDAHHPEKRHRPIPAGEVTLLIAGIEWAVLGFLGLVIAFHINWGFFKISVLLTVMGFLYNVRPFRLKDVAYLDVLSESVNNPIRLLLGWYAVGNENVVPLSLVMSYWMLGAFLMAVKRYAEYSFIGSSEIASKYRKSFSYYNLNRLLTSIIYYATAFGLFSGMFLIRYRVELILSIPFIAGFIAYYLHLGFKENSPTQYPEKLYKERLFVFYALLCSVVIVLLLFVDIPMLREFFRPSGAPQRS